MASSKHFNGDDSYRDYYWVKVQTPPIPSQLQGPGTFYSPIYGSGSACYQDHYANTIVSVARVDHSDGLLKVYFKERTLNNFVCNINLRGV